MILALAVGAIGLIAVAGCGGGGSSSSAGAGNSESGGGFAATAEAACAKADKQIAALGTPQQADVLEYMERTEAVIEELHRRVGAAAGDGAAEAAYVKGLATAVPVLDQMTNAARNENYDAVRELSAGLVEIHLGELAEAAELKVCAEVPVSTS
ncbi:MAG TPA: hypothetical protein VMF55_15065 [Solirubrobacterales bacterium]|nr:hypothetical protein [Solirubrobacterales bacterium]